MTFTTANPITQLHPHQVLALINRWAKLKSYWYYADRDVLYHLKDELIFKWVNKGSMVATKVIQRESSVIEAMKQEISTGGASLDHLEQFGLRWDDVLNQVPSYSKLLVLTSIVNESKDKDEYATSDIEAALDWARETLNQPNLKVSDITDDMECTLEHNVAEEALEKMRFEAVEIFKKVVNGELNDPLEIYNQLTNLDLDYAYAIDMNSYSDHYGNTTHSNFSRWHEINFSPTGHWLIEFESKVDSIITFHIPYDRAESLKLIPPNLPKEESKQDTFGRPITCSEQKEYPISQLLKMLGKKPEDFPHGLQKHKRPGYHA